MPRMYSEVVVPSSLQSRAREAFIDELYGVHSQIFDGVDRDAFVHYVVDSPAERTKILVHRDEAGEPVGYFATAAGLERSIRVAVPRLPRALRYCPARLDAERRLAGQPGRDPGAVRLERLIAAVFAVEPRAVAQP